MGAEIKVRPEGWWGWIGDILMSPLMYVLSGVWLSRSCERPQRTHRWNCVRLSSHDVDELDDFDMVHRAGDRSARPRTFFGLPLFHMPLFGGWKNYVVLYAPSCVDDWYVGWITCDSVGISRIPLYMGVRMLIGPHPVSFFGVSVADGRQVRVQQAGEGRIGDRGVWRSVPFS